jgi:hypothetical protein
MMVDEDEWRGGEKAKVAWTDFIGYMLELLLFPGASTNVRTLANAKWAVM